MPDLPIVFVACKVFESLLLRHIPPGLETRVSFLDYGLHAVPKNLRQTLQETIDAVQVASLVVLAYGMCGNGLKGIRSGIHTLLIPGTEDCIAIFLGSDEAYRAEFSAHPGTYYLTGGWLEAGSDPLKEYEQMLEKYGQKTADFVMDAQYKNYRRLALIGHSEDDLRTYRDRAMQVADFCGRWGMSYQEIRGSDGYVKRLVEAALDPTKIDAAFRLITPGNIIE